MRYNNTTDTICQIFAAIESMAAQLAADAKHGASRKKLQQAIDSATRNTLTEQNNK